MFDEPHVDVTGQQRELDRAKFSEGSAFPAAAGGDRLVPHRRYFFAQLLLLDLHQAGKKLRDFFDAVTGLLGLCHDRDIDSNS